MGCKLQSLIGDIATVATKKIIFAVKALILLEAHVPFPRQQHETAGRATCQIIRNGKALENI